MNTFSPLSLFALVALAAPALASENNIPMDKDAAIDIAFKHLGDQGRQLEDNTYRWLIPVAVTEFNPHASMPANNNTPTIVTQPQTQAYHTTMKACEVTVSVKNNQISDATLSGAGCDEYKNSESYQRFQKALWPPLSN